MSLTSTYTMSALTFDPPKSLPRTGKKTSISSDTSSGPKKPKKVNSELRKQQNRIASRNYREKRKRKLQYLQQLLQDDPNNPQSPQTPELHHHDRTRSMSAEYFVPTPSLTPMSYHSVPDYSALSPTSSNVIDPVLSTPSIMDSRLHHPSSQSYSSIEQPWNPPPLYEPVPETPVPACSWQWGGMAGPSYAAPASHPHQIHTPPPSDVPHPANPQAQYSHYYHQRSVSPQHLPSLEPQDSYLTTPYGSSAIRATSQAPALVARSPFPSPYLESRHSPQWT